VVMMDEGRPGQRRRERPAVEKVSPSMPLAGPHSWVDEIGRRERIWGADLRRGRAKGRWRRRTLDRPGRVLLS
jgi:hypothetical protein